MVNWDEIDTVLLDMDGTLLDLYFDNFFWQEYLPIKWGELHGLGPDEAKASLTPRFRSMKGTLSWYCLDYWTEQLELDVLALKADVEHLIAIRPKVEEFLLHIRDLRKSVVMVTNAHQKLIDLKMEKTGIERYFDRIFCAHGLGAAKEDPAFWHRLGDQISFASDRTLLIDDNLTVLRTARAYGIRHLLTIARPDSHAAGQQVEEFIAVECFSTLLQA